MQALWLTVARLISIRAFSWGPGQWSATEGAKVQASGFERVCAATQHCAQCASRSTDA